MTEANKKQPVYNLDRFGSQGSTFNYGGHGSTGRKMIYVSQADRERLKTAEQLRDIVKNLSQEQKQTDSL